MKNWNRRTLILMLGILICLPLLVEWHLVWRDVGIYKNELREQDRRDELLSMFECVRPGACPAVDFDKDGTYEFLSVGMMPGFEGQWLSVENMKGVPLLVLPFSGKSPEGDWDIRIAIVEAKGESHLLVYDEYNHFTRFKTVYRHDGLRLSDTTPTPLESDILSAMEMDGAGTIKGDEMTDKSYRSLFKLFCYYFALAVFVLVLIYRRGDNANSGNAYFSLRGHP